ncbi:MAG: preprotein translocase subunit SecG [Actinobacteria bacterium]|nr:preprotein translocase subunit SecG [Actinomycetota bacterium]
MPGAPRRFGTLVRPSETGASVSERLVVLYFLVGLHVLVSFAMLGLVLLHSGKGGGLSDMFGGGMGAAAQGSTVVEKNLDRLTVVTAVIFTFTTLGLGLMMSTPT